MSFRQKIALIILGFFLCVILLEIGLRIGGFVFSSLQEYRNRISISKKGTYRIMCLGESTTAGQYPSFLEEILNQRSRGVKFSVINKGVGGITTLGILARLESNLEEYHPHMVVTMMGINDFGTHMPYEAVSDSRIIRLFRSFRTYKLARLLWLHILTKAKEMGFSKPHKDRQPIKRLQSNILKVELKRAYAEEVDSISDTDSPKKTIELNPSSYGAYVGLGWLYQEQGKFPPAEEAFKKAIELNPQNNWGAYVGLGWVYQEQGKFLHAEKVFKKAVELSPSSDVAYVGLGRLYREQGKYSLAEEVFKKAIELNPHNDCAYTELGWLYQVQGKFLPAEQAFKKATELNPQSNSAWGGLGWLNQDQGKFSPAEEAYKKAIELSPQSDRAYEELGRLYQAQGKNSSAEEAFKKAIELSPQNDKVFGALAVLYEEMGKPGLAKVYGKRAEELRLSYYNPVTINNYHKLKEILDKRGIRLVCVQYPIRSLGPLKKIFQGNEEGIIFVDNERIFKDAVKKGGYKEYFNDMIGGDFGHCTPKGNRLLAENIADAILRESFNK